MGIARNASAISAGALAIALGGGLPLVAAAPAQAFDCTGGGGLVSGITNSVCSVVDGVTNVVDGATGGVAAPVTKTVDDTVSTVTNTAGTAVSDVGQTVGTAVSGVGDTLGTTGKGVDTTVDTVTDTVKGTVKATTAGASPGVQGITDGLTKTVQDSCLPLVGDAQCDSAAAVRPGNQSPARPKPSRTPEGTLPVEPYRPPVTQPGFVRTGDQFVSGDARVNPDEDGGIPLLWPGQEVPALTSQMRGQPVRPRTPYDAAGTALTAALLLSAVLATRVVSARRARAGEQESIPFEGGMRMPGTPGRHRLA